MKKIFKGISKNNINTQNYSNEKNTKEKRNIENERLKLVAISQNILDYNVGDLHTNSINVKKKVLKFMFKNERYTYEKVLSDYILNKDSINELTSNCRKLSSIIEDNVNVGYILEFSSQNNKKMFVSVDGILTYNAFQHVDLAEERNVKYAEERNVKYTEERNVKYAEERNVKYTEERNVKYAEEIISKFLPSEGVDGNLNNSTKVFKIQYNEIDKTFGEIKENFCENNDLSKDVETKLLEINNYLGIDYTVQLISKDNKMLFEMIDCKMISTLSDVNYNDDELEKFLNDFKDRYNLNFATFKIDYLSKIIEFNYTTQEYNYIDAHTNVYHRRVSKHSLKKLCNILKYTNYYEFRVCLYSYDGHMLDEYINGIQNMTCNVTGYLNVVFGRVGNNIFRNYNVSIDDKRLELFLTDDYSDLAMLYMLEKKDSTLLNIIKDIHQGIFDFTLENFTVEMITSNDICIYRVKSFISEYNFFDENNIEITIK